MTEISISNRRRVLEIGAVLLTALGKFLFMDYLNWRFPFVVSAIVAWAVYILYRSRTKDGILRYWGFRRDNLNIVIRKVLPFGILAVVTFLGFGFFQGTINVTWHIVPILLLYPIWGVVQQFLLIALIAGNLQDMEGQKLNKILIILFSALLFASIHYPFLWLIIGTFILATFYGFVYLKERNIYILGLFHGWLGGLFYYTVLDRNPFLETFGRLIYETN